MDLSVWKTTQNVMKETLEDLFGKEAYMALQVGHMRPPVLKFKKNNAGLVILNLYSNEAAPH